MTLATIACTRAFCSAGKYRSAYIRPIASLIAASVAASARSARGVSSTAGPGGADAAPAPPRRRRAAARRRTRPARGNAGSPSTPPAAPTRPAAASPVSRGRLPHDERLLPGQPRRLEERRPVHPRRPPREIGPRPHAVGVLVVGRCLLRGLGLGEGRLERHHRRRPLLRPIEARQRQQPADVRLVLRPGAPACRARC